MYFISSGSSKEGPLTFEEVLSKRPTDDTLIWKDGLQNWIPIRELTEFKDHVISVPPPLPPNNVSLKVSQAKRKYHEKLKGLFAEYSIWVGGLFLVINIILTKVAQGGGSDKFPIAITFEERNDPLLLFKSFAPYSLLISIIIVAIVYLGYYFYLKNQSYNSKSLNQARNESKESWNKGQDNSIRPHKLVGQDEGNQDLHPLCGDNGKWGYGDSTGKIIIPCTFDSVRPFKSSVAVAELNNKYGVISLSGETILGFTFDYLEDMSEFLFVAKRNRKFGYVDIFGNVVFDFLYDDAEGFKNGIANVKKDGKTFTINRGSST